MTVHCEEPLSSGEYGADQDPPDGSLVWHGGGRDSQEIEIVTVCVQTYTHAHTPQDRAGNSMPEARPIPAFLPSFFQPIRFINAPQGDHVF